MAVTLPYVLSNQVCVFLIIVFAPIVFYVSGLHVWTHLRNYRNPGRSSFSPPLGLADPSRIPRNTRADPLPAPSRPAPLPFASQ